MVSFFFSPVREFLYSIYPSSTQVGSTRFFSTHALSISSFVYSFFDDVEVTDVDVEISDVDVAVSDTDWSAPVDADEADPGRE